eukprot:scaffold183624_cov18-Prasinocladus_malaysianus.AAC.1
MLRPANNTTPQIAITDAPLALQAVAIYPSDRTLTPMLCFSRMKSDRSRSSFVLNIKQSGVNMQSC